LVVAFCAFKIMPRNDSMGAAVGLAIFLGSTFMGVTNLLPVRAGTQMLDGLKIWILLFTRRRRDRLLLLLTFAADARKGDFQRFLTDGSVESSSLIRDGSDQQVVASLLGYFKAATAKDYELAGRCLENSLVAASSVSRDMRETLALEAARYQALRRNRADLARQWLDVERSEAVTAMRCLVEAYVLYREDEYELAERKTDQGLVILDSLPEGAQRTSQQASLRNMKAALGKLRAGEADNGILLD
jgi:hypothetical protein